ncbi:MAG: NADPH:quinone reductase [Frankiales bacterium]|nr:NADPH:quinone reductase [Frankiales bacterium]
MTELMRAVAFAQSQSGESALDVELPVPTPGPHDLLVRVQAVSVNPVDTKARRPAAAGEFKVVGYDAAGTVVATGSEVTLYEVGEDVMYAGAINRPGTNSQFHLVDQRIVGPKPASLSFAEAAALPLTAITAWEVLFDRLRLGPASTGTLLVVAAAGGVGSMICQLARTMTDLEVIGTASRPASAEWARTMGAQHVVDHHGDLVAEVHALAPSGVEYLFSPRTPGNLDRYAELIKPFGHLAVIDESDGAGLMSLKSKSVAWHWHSMFTRSVYGTPDMIEQHRLLAAVSSMVDSGGLRTTLASELSPINAANIQQAHQQVSAGSMIGKVVVSDW